MTDQYPKPDPDAGGIHIDQGGLALALVGAVIGGVLGYFAFYWLVSNMGLAFVALPGAAVGFGRIAATRTRSVIVAAMCGVGAIGLGLYIANEFYAGGITATPPMGWGGIILGAFAAIWFGLGRRKRT